MPQEWPVWVEWFVSKYEYMCLNSYYMLYTREIEQSQGAHEGNRRNEYMPNTCTNADIIAHLRTA